MTTIISTPSIPRPIHPMNFADPRRRNVVHTAPSTREEMFVKAADFDFGAFTNISSLVDGAVWTTFLLLGSAKFMGWIGRGILGVLMIVEIGRATCRNKE